MFVTLPFQRGSIWLCCFSPRSGPAAVGVDLQHLPALACLSHAVVAPGSSMVLMEEGARSHTTWLDPWFWTLGTRL